MPDYSAVSHLFAIYAATQDERDFETLNNVFTEDCSFTVEISGGDKYGPFENREKTLEFITGAIQAQTDQRRHVITNVRLKGDTAYSILSLFVTENGELTAQATGVYECEVVGDANDPRFKSMYLTLDRPF